MSWKCWGSRRGTISGGRPAPSSPRTREGGSGSGAWLSGRTVFEAMAESFPGSAGPNSAVGRHTGCAVAARNVLLQQGNELAGDAVSPERDLEPAIHEYRGLGILSRARQRNADVGVAGLAGAIHHAPHHRHLQLLDPG